MTGASGDGEWDADGVAALEAYRRRLEGAMLAGNVAWWEMDVQTGAVSFHDNKAEMLGLSPEDFDHYEDFTERLHPDDYEATMEAMRAHLDGRRDRYDVEYRIRDADGDYQWFHDVGGVTEWTDEGAPRSVTGIVVGVTERKRTEQRLRDANAELGLLNRIVRHDIRNDMTVVLGYLDMLAESAALDDTEREYLERARRAAEHTTQLTETVRDLVAVIEGDADAVALEPVDLLATVDAEILRVTDTFDDVVVTTDYPEREVAVAATKMLSTVVGNLLTNAVQHTDEETARIAVDVTVDDDTATVRIADNGPGIPASIRDDLFERQTKGPESLGSGMGLYLVQSLVAAFGGRVSVADNDPKGTVATVELRLADELDDADEGDA